MRTPWHFGRTVAKVASALGEDQPWCLVGGLMVALFAIEAGEMQRPTADIDILADARRRPSGTERASVRLQELGAELREVDGLDAKRGFRFDVDGQIVDVLAPDGLGTSGATTIGGLRTIEIPGGTQALDRTEIVDIVVDGESFGLRRPTLIGATLLKARALAVHSRPEDQRHDIVTLLSLLNDPRAAREQITRKEQSWLRAIDDRLALDDAALAEPFAAARLRVARAAYRILAD